MKQWVILTHFLNARSQERIWENPGYSRGVIFVCALHHEYVYELGILNQTIWSLARYDIVKRFEMLIEFSLWGPFTVIAEL